jgi:hypothetical protein
MVPHIKLLEIDTLLVDEGMPTALYAEIDLRRVVAYRRGVFARE